MMSRKARRVTARILAGTYEIDDEVLSERLAKVIDEHVAASADEADASADEADASADASADELEEEPPPPRARRAARVSSLPISRCRLRNER